jgi:hypothetical protein
VVENFHWLVEPTSFNAPVALIVTVAPAHTTNELGEVVALMAVKQDGGGVKLYTVPLGKSVAALMPLFAVLIEKVAFEMLVLHL